MNSIFDLKTSVDELDATNQGTSRMAYDQHPPTRDITNGAFSNGAIRYRFSTAGQKWWMPSRSYLRMRMSITKNGTDALDIADGVAPTMGTCASLFQSAEMRINDKVVSRIGDFMPQIDALETRLSKSKSWLDSAGNSTNLWQTDFAERQSVVAVDGKKSSNVSNESYFPFAAATTLAISDAGVATLVGENNGTAAIPNGAAATLKVNVGDIIKIGAKVFEVTEVTAGASTFQVNVLIPITAVGVTQIKAGGVDTGAIQVAFSRAINTARRLKDFELIWTPPLSLFKIDHALPSGNYELILTPQPGVTFQQYGIESLVNKIPNQDYKLSVEDMYFYCNVVDGKRADDITYLLDLDTTSCQSDNIKTTALQQRNFDVSPSTYALSVAYQDLRVGQDTRFSPSKFKSYNNNGDVNTELNLERFYLNYAGQSLPAPDADPTFDVNIDKTTQRYADTMLYNGGIFDAGGCETIEEYHDRGSYYYFSIPRDGSDRSTQVAVHNQFKTNTEVTNMRALLFAHSKQVARVSVSDGRVVSVSLEDA
jgi:hypothetical protein